MNRQFFDMQCDVLRMIQSLCPSKKRLPQHVSILENALMMNAWEKQVISRKYYELLREELKNIVNYRKKTINYYCLTDFGEDMFSTEYITREYIQDKLYDANLQDKVYLKGVYLYGSRSRGKEKTDSDIDIVVEYTTIPGFSLKEYEFFNMLHSEELDSELSFSGIVVDINPIYAEKSMSMGEFLVKAEKYMICGI